MNIACGYLYCQHKAVPVARGMRFIRKLPFMFPFDKHSAVRIRCGNRSGYGFSSLRRIAFVVIILVRFFFNRLFAQLFTLGVHFLPKLLCVYLGCFGYLLFLELLFVCTCLDMRPVNEYDAGVYHAVVQRLVENMLKDFLCQLGWKSFTKGIAYRSKMRNVIQKIIS